MSNDPPSYDLDDLLARMFEWGCGWSDPTWDELPPEVVRGWLESAAGYLSHAWDIETADTGRWAARSEFEAWMEAIAQ